MSLIPALFKPLIILYIMFTTRNHRDKGTDTQLEHTHSLLWRATCLRRVAGKSSSSSPVCSACPSFASVFPTFPWKPGPSSLADPPGLPWRGADWQPTAERELQAVATSPPAVSCRWWGRHTTHGKVKRINLWPGKPNRYVHSSDGSFSAALSLNCWQCISFLPHNY